MNIYTLHKKYRLLVTKHAKEQKRPKQKKSSFHPEFAAKVL